MPAPDFDLTLPVPYDDQAPLLLQVAGKAWAGIAEPYRTQRRIVVPDWLVDNDHRVGDDAAYVVDADFRLQEVDTSAVADGCIVVVLESPHKREFDGQGGRALRPLQDKNNRRSFECCMPNLLRNAARLTDVDVAGRQLIIANAVQYQTSLQALMTCYGAKLAPKIRDQVWTELFRAGGAADLIGRLDTYDPAMVVMAPTKKVSPLVVDCVRLARRPWPSILLDEHPARWWYYKPSIVDLIPGRM